MPSVDIILYVACALLVRVNFTPAPQACEATPGPIYLGEQYSFEMRSMFYNSRLTSKAVDDLHRQLGALTDGRYSALLDKESGLLVVADKRPAHHPLTLLGWNTHAPDRFYYELSTDVTTPIVFKGRDHPRLKLH